MKREADHCCQQVMSYLNSCIPVRRLAQANATETIPVARFHITPGERESRVLTNVYTHLWWQHSSTILLYMQYKPGQGVNYTLWQNWANKTHYKHSNNSVLTSDITEMNMYGLTHGFRDNTELQIYPRLAIIPPNGRVYMYHIASVTWTQYEQCNWE